MIVLVVLGYVPGYFIPWHTGVPNMAFVMLGYAPGYFVLLRYPGTKPGCFGEARVCTGIPYTVGYPATKHVFFVILGYLPGYLIF